MTQHTIQLPKELYEAVRKRVADDGLEVNSPHSRGLMPQGYCLLFVLNLDGVPSVGKFVQLR